MKYFNLFDGYVQTQLSAQMTGSAYRNLIQEKGEIDVAAQRERKRAGRALILCLDKSGSMSGTPYNALKEGSILVAKSVFENKEFEHFVTLFYDSNATAMVADSYEEYERKMRATNAGGGTCFFTCFEYIQKFCTDKEGIRDISVIFFTDGQDGDRNRTDASIVNLSAFLNQREIVNRYLTLGFSRDHDAVFLNKIAQSGSEMGNFFFIDTHKAGYVDDVKENLSSSLSMAGQAEDGLLMKLISEASKTVEKLVLAKSPIFVKPAVVADEEEKKGDEDMVDDPTVEITLQADEIQMYDFSKKLILEEGALKDLKGLVVLPTGETPV